MTLRNTIFSHLCILFIVVSCNDERNLPSVEIRVSEAIASLQKDLLDAPNGWLLEYSPETESGTFLLLLNFEADGSVRIQSDVSSNDGEFLDHKILYRIDNGLGLELIFETYGVLHYMFELDQSTFGAEFEFSYLKKEGSDLIFESKSDISNKTIIRFELADTDIASLFSGELSKNLEHFNNNIPQLFGGISPIQQLVLEEKNISVFWSINLKKRYIEFDFAGVGTTYSEIMSGESGIFLNHSTGYKLLDGSLILNDPLTITVGGNTVELENLPFTTFSFDGISLCPSKANPTPIYQGDSPNLGSFKLGKSLFNSKGAEFIPLRDNVYSVNSLFIVDDSVRSLQQEGIIADRIPNATGFIFSYGFESDELPKNSLGFVIPDSLGESSDLYMREFEILKDGNRFEISLLDKYYFSGTTSPEDEKNLVDITDEIFEGGVLYTFDLPVEGLKIFRLYNPCNGYEILLVQ